MLKLNKSIQIKTIVLSLGILFSAGLYAQNEKTSDKSTIVMTKSELNSFLSTVADARRAQLTERENKDLKQYLAELRLKYQQVSGREYNNYQYSPNENGSNQQILNELRYLNQRIDRLESNGSGDSKSSRNNSTIIVPGASSSYLPNNRKATTNVYSNSKKINELQSKIDSLKRVDASTNGMAKEKSYADPVKSMNRNLADVRRQMEILESKMMASNKRIVKSKESGSNKSYFKQRVYFENNSETLSDRYLKDIQDLTQILKDYPEAKILLEGWASPLGKVNYNKQLSMRRAESAKKAFVDYGVDANRIISAFKGEDKISSAEEARRVDMSIIVK